MPILFSDLPLMSTAPFPRSPQRLWTMFCFKFQNLSSDCPSVPPPSVPSTLPGLHPPTQGMNPSIGAKVLSQRKKRSFSRWHAHGGFQKSDVTGFLLEPLSS